MKKLTTKDFKTVEMGQFNYKTHLGKNCEICIENGFRCIDIAVYDLEKELLEPKVTINSPEAGRDNLEVFATYLRQINTAVNRFYKKWELKK